MAWGASPQPSATFILSRDVIGTFRSYKPAFSVQIRAGRPCSCSLKKTASLINSIALDEGRMSERYRPGAPILAALSGFSEYALAKYRGEAKALKLVDAVNLLHPRHSEALKAVELSRNC
jgi:hypothetical protein